MTVDVDDVIRVVAEWDMVGGTIAQLVYHFKGASGTAVADATLGAAIEAALQAAWANISGRIANDMVGGDITTFKWDFALSQFDGIDITPMVGIDGEVSTSMLTHGAAALIKIFTTKPRRQARKYLPGLGSGEVSDGFVQALALSDLALFAADLDDDLVAGSLTLEYGVFNTDPLSALFETFAAASGEVEAESIIAYQRRRRPGTGI